MPSLSECQRAYDAQESPDYYKPDHPECEKCNGFMVWNDGIEDYVCEECTGAAAPE